MNIIVTGADGFVGRHLLKELYENNVRIIAVGGPKSIGASDDIKQYIEEYIGIDLTDAKVVEQLNTYDPDGVIHLAGLAAVGPSFDNPQRYIQANSAMVTNLCELYVNTTKKPRILLISSGAVYDSFQPMPITESSSLGFNSPYAVSKVLNENQAAYYRKRGLEVIVARPFNHIGPNQLPGFLVPDLIKQLEVAQQTSQPLRVGNLATRRDYTDVRDVVKAYRLLITENNLTHHTYNVCSGVSHSGEEILTMLKKLMNAENVDTEIDQSKIRPNDPQDIYGDCTVLKQDTGWEPEYSLEQTLTDILAVK